VPVVSADAASAMASGVRERLGATYALSLTGVAGPAEQDGQPVGTVFCGLAGPSGASVRALRLPGDRSLVRSYAVTAALNLLRLHLLGAE
jgi:nicotinamide-nucleotide amidase